MKILVTAAYFDPAEGFGGPVQSVGSLVTALHAEGVEVVVLTTDADGVRSKCVPEPGWKIRNGVKVHYSRCRGLSKPSVVGRFFFSPGLGRQLLAAVPEFDLVHVQGSWVFPSYAGSRAALIFGKPYVLSVRGGMFPWAMGDKSWKKRFSMALYERETLRGCARVHFTTPLEARMAESVFPGLPAAIVPNPVALPPPRPDGRGFRNLLGIGDKAPLVAFLGRITPVKGLDLIVEAAAAIIREVPGVVFALVGGDENGHAAEVGKLIARRGLGSSVLLPGAVQGTEKWSALAAADIFVLPSHQENFGMSAAEAMACGVPVVTSTAVGIAEDIAEAGAGLVVDRTPEAFAGAVVALLRDSAARRRMGDAGRDLVARRYSPSVVSQSMIRLYGEVIEEHAKRPVSRRARWARSIFGRRGREESR